MAEPRAHRYWKTKITLVSVVAVFALLAVGFHLRTRVIPPDPGNPATLFPEADSVAPGFYRAGNNWLRHSTSGLWEMYLEGGAFERGVINGRLTRRLIAEQESAFIGQIREMIPSDFYLRFLKYFIYWFNRDLDRHVAEEYRQEIYGISLSAPDAYNFIGAPYQRMLNYHSAHDIGHALQDLMLVGCTSFGVWGDRSADGSLIIGRNFDFYVGDEFARNKIVAFVRPDSGHPFMMVTWAGMAGVVSGMNAAGLTVTINAAKSDIPGSARTPISLLAREILQYASTIKEAYDLASRRETFVSESILVGSARDKKAVVLEKSPFRMGVLQPASDHILCANHFQSATFRTDSLNLGNMEESASVYRYRRLLQHISQAPPIGPLEAAAILRDRQGLNGADIGLGNEKAMNQMIAHHSVIFIPEKGLAWVSTSPWQEGPYICYNLFEIFHNFAALRHQGEIAETDLAIPPDPFLGTDEFNRFRQFRTWKIALKNSIRTGDTTLMQGTFPDEFRNSNPRFYETYKLLGDYYSGRGNWRLASAEYRQALRMEFPNKPEKEKVIKKLADCIEKMQPQAGLNRHPLKTVR